jgi:excisionase family DNA binding protein
MPIPDKQFYRPDELSAVLDVNVGTIRRWIRLGLVAAVYVGKHRRISRAEMLRILTEGISKKKK